MNKKYTLILTLFICIMMQHKIGGPAKVSLILLLAACLLSAINYVSEIQNKLEQENNI